MTDGRDGDDASDWLAAQFEEPTDDAEPDGASADGEAAGTEAAGTEAMDVEARDIGPADAEVADGGHDGGTGPKMAGVSPGEGAGSASSVPGGTLAAPVAAAGAPGAAAPAAGGFRWGLRSGESDSVTPEPEGGPGPASETEPIDEPEPVDETESTVAEPLPAVPAVPAVPSEGIVPSAAPPPDGRTRVFDREPARGDGSAPLDELFDAGRFRDYAPVPAAEGFPAEPPVSARAEEAPRAAGPGIPKNQRILLWIAGILVSVLAIVALFLIGTKLPGMLGPAPAVLPVHSASPSPSPSVSPSPSPAVAVAGPVAPGEYKWDKLLGGECINPYTSPWVEQFTVVDCATEHAAQLVHRGVFGPDDGQATPYPGIEALQTQINILCTAPTVIDYAAASAYNDIQFAAGYPVTQKQWVDGDRDYYCFVTRSSGAPLTTSVAVPQAAPAG